MRLDKKVFLGMAALLLFANAGRSIYSLGNAVPALGGASEPNGFAKPPVIIIDPGHGGADGGAVGVDGIVEKDINLSICLVLRDFFEVSGFEVIMTRDADISIHDEGLTGTRKQKTSDLHNRLAIAEAYPGAIFLSIHQNKFGQSSSRGAQIFFGPNNEQSEKLANVLQKNFIARLQPDNHREVKRAGKDLFLMYNAQCPAVLVECGFLSNPEEGRMLTDPDYQSRVAFVTFASVLEYLDMELPPQPVPKAEAIN